MTAFLQSVLEAFFIAAPLNILPLLSASGRMDLIDLYKAEQKAVINHRLGGRSELLHLSADSLLLLTTPSTSWGLKLLPDSTLRLTRKAYVPDTIVHTEHFTKHWHPKR